MVSGKKGIFRIVQSAAYIIQPENIVQIEARVPIFFLVSIGKG